MSTLFIAWYPAACTRRLMHRHKQPEPEVRGEFTVTAGLGQAPATRAAPAG